MHSAVLKPAETSEEYTSPVPSVLSFGPYLRYLEEQLAESEGIKSGFYRFILRKFRQHKLFADSITNPELLQPHKELLELVEATIFPLTHSDGNDMFALTTPMTFEIFYYSPAMFAMLADKKSGFIKPIHESFPRESFKKKKESFLYSYILEKFYGIVHHLDHTMVFPLWDDTRGLMRYFSVKVDKRFINVLCSGTLPVLDAAQTEMLRQESFSADLVRPLIPLSGFSLEGFAIINIEEVTAHESVEQIKNTLLGIYELSEAEVFDYIAGSLKTLLQENEIQVGLLPFLKVNNRFVIDEEASSRSILIRSGCDCAADDNAYQQLAEKYEKEAKPFVLSNIDAGLLQQQPMLQGLYEAGIRGYMLLPLYNRGKLVGVLELATTKTGQLTNAFLSRLAPAQALLSQVLQHSIDAFESRIEQTIKEKFTSLQPSVEWKFSEVAWNHIRSHDTKKDVENVVFENVYPVYGAVDIRNSSVERNAAIQKDYQQHLALLHETLTALSSYVQIPLLDEISFKCTRWQSAISGVLNAEDEVKITDFFDSEVKPLLEHFLSYKDGAEAVVAAYFEKTAPEGGLVHQHRSRYETSVELINTTLLKYFEKEKAALQRSYPNYFEKYKTDGVEYNIYIGQSIAPEKPFDEIYLKNLRLWQLSSMAQTARLTEALLPQLPSPLHTTQLILIHSNPISISFRRDERRFDVEGAYNIRYEIMKKRIDKIHVKETGERLTQPGKIALVYSNQKEADEYTGYIQYLQQKKQLDDNLEHLELEEVQGLPGLRALRAGVLFY